MKKNNIFLNSIIRTFVICFLLGGFFAVLNYVGIGITYVVAMTFGVLVLAADYFCLVPVYNNYINNKIQNDGIRTDAYIEKVISRDIHPACLRMGPDRKVILPEDMSNAYILYELELSYYASGTEYRKKIITPYTTPAQLEPYVINEGNRIPIKYLEKFPKKMVIAIPAMFDSLVYGQKKLLRRTPLFAFVITVIYAFYVITRFF